MLEEKREEHPVEGSSDRAFGLTVGGILLAIEGYRFWSSQELDIAGYILLAIGVPLVLFGCIYPAILAPLNRAWMKLGLLMFKVVNPVVMFLIYVTAVVPTGLIMKMLGKDLLNLKLDPDAKSYWIERTPPGPKPESMKNQF